MTDYTKTTNLPPRMPWSSGNPAKVVKGTEVNTEFDNIATAVATKANLAGPTFTGTTTAANLTVSGTFTGTIDGGTY